PTPGGRRHCPDQSGYFERSGICAAAPAAPSASTNAAAPISFRIMASLQRLSLSLTTRSFEVPQIGRLLVLLCRHQIAVGAQEIVFLADDHMMIVLGAIIGVPDRLVIAAEFLGHRPGASERVVDGRDPDVERVLVLLILIEALLNHSRAVLVQRNPAALEHARTLDDAALGLVHVVFCTG